ncbi:MAG: hypothetical protein J6N18_00740 [Kiritimatiellae bacterium]|nr:hypothetical protein [Kiritimatiellia bacterium]
MSDNHTLKGLSRRDFLMDVTAVTSLAAAGCSILPKAKAGIGGPFVTLRDGSWLYGHDSGDHDGLGNNPMNHYNVPMSAPITVADAALGFGLQNVSVCRWGLTDDEYIRQYRGLKRVSWAITGAKNERYPKLLEHNFSLLDKMPNLVAFDLDDYFRSASRGGPDERVVIDGRQTTVARAGLPYFELMRLSRRVKARQDRNLALQLVVYDYMLRKEMRPVFDAVNTIQYWTWCGKDISGLEKRFRFYRSLAPGKPTFLGIYMWDYGGRRRLDLDFMKHQLKVGFGLWQRGEIEGFVFHCSNLLNKNLPPAEYARAWFAEHADAERKAAAFHEVEPPPETEERNGAVVIPDLSVPAARAAAIRRSLDGSGRKHVPLLIGGDEWMPFTGTTGRQILACGKDRIVIVEPSGRVAWKREGIAALTCVRIRGNDIYWTDGSLRRTGFSMGKERTEPEFLYRGPTDACDLQGFDFAANGAVVVAAGASRMVVELDPETFVPFVWIKTEKEPCGVRKTRRNSYLTVFDDSVAEYDSTGVKIAEWNADGKRVSDALRLADGTTLVAVADEVRAYAPDGGFRRIVSAGEIDGAGDGMFSSLQRLANGELVVGVKRTSLAGSPALAAFAIDRDGKVSWRIDSTVDAGMCAVQKIQGREEYD